MAAKIKVSGELVNVNNIKILLNGLQRRVAKGYVLVAGEWRLWYDVPASPDEPFKVEEYDALNLPVQDYDSKELSVEDYDNHGKLYLP